MVNVLAAFWASHSPMEESSLSFAGTCALPLRSTPRSDAQAQGLRVFLGGHAVYWQYTLKFPLDLLDFQGNMAHA